MSERSDLLFDPDLLGDDLVVECWISEGPRAVDRSFDPTPPDEVLVDDGAGLPLRARVIDRQGDRVRVRIEAPDPGVVRYVRLAFALAGIGRSDASRAVRRCGRRRRR